MPDGHYAHCTSGGDFVLSKEYNMKTRWAFPDDTGFLPSAIHSFAPVTVWGSRRFGSPYRWIADAAVHASILGAALYRDCGAHPRCHQSLPAASRPAAAAWRIAIPQHTRRMPRTTGSRVFLRW